MGHLPGKDVSKVLKQGSTCMVYMHTCTYSLGDQTWVQILNLVFTDSINMGGPVYLGP